MKNPSIERHVHNLIFNTNEHFVHQELLWAKDLDRFENPSETIFLPYMHPIIFNITRTWVTVSIILTIDCLPKLQDIPAQQPPAHTLQSLPFNFIDWSINNYDNILVLLNTEVTPFNE